MIKVKMHNAAVLKQHAVVLGKIQTLVESINRDGEYTHSGSSKPIKLTKTEKEFVKYLNANNQKKLLWIINSDAAEIRDKIISEIESKFDAFAKDRAKVGGKKVHFSKLHRLASFIFINNGYNKLTSKGEFYRALQLHVCPYCNITNIWPIEEKGRNDTMKGQLDHFYCKSRFPYLAFSIYNLIPSCHVCNGKGRKGEKDFYALNAQHPYLLNDSDGMRFKYKMTRHKHKDLDDLWQTVMPLFVFKPNADLSVNFRELRLKPLYQDKEHRQLIINTTDVVCWFCDPEYIKYVESYFLKKYGLKPNFDNLLKKELKVQSNHDRYSDYPNNKFVLDIFQNALKKSGKKLLV